MATVALQINDNMIVNSEGKAKRDKYTCPCCKGLLVNAVQPSCGHWMCKTCADDLLEIAIENGNVPVCLREDCMKELTVDEFEHGTYYFPDHFVHKEVMKIVIACCNVNRGCQWSGYYSELKGHLKDCEFDGECQTCRKSQDEKQFLPSHIPSGVNTLQCSAGTDVVTYKVTSYDDADLVVVDKRQLEIAMDCMHYANQAITNLKRSLRAIDLTSPDSERQRDTDEAQKKSDSIHVARKASKVNSFNIGRTFSYPHQEGACSPRVSGDQCVAQELSSDEESVSGPSITEHRRRRPNLAAHKKPLQVDGIDNTIFVLPLPESHAHSQKVSVLPVSFFTASYGRRDSESLEIVPQPGALESAIPESCAATAVPTQIYSWSDVCEKQSRIMQDSTIHEIEISYMAQRMDQARTGLTPFFHSSVFYVQGYKMCVRIFLNGDGDGKGTHMSVFLVLMKGEKDKQLAWPFLQTVTFKLISNSGNDGDVLDVSFRPQLNSRDPSFKKPKTEMNPAIGFPCFVSHNELFDRFIHGGDTVYLSVSFNPKFLFVPLMEPVHSSC